MTIDDMIAVLQAAKDGEKIQCRHREDITKEWDDCRSSEHGAGPTWNFFSYDYRVVPKPREAWLPEIKYGYASKEECKNLWPKYRPVLFREVL